MEGLDRLWDRFDFKAACLFTGYKNRASGLFDELSRVGLSDVKIMWQFPTPMDRPLMRGICGKMSRHQGFFNSGMGHYRAIKTAYELGSEHCLILEDDIRFMKDLKGLSEIINDLPDDYDVALFDVIKPMKMGMSECLDNARKNKVSRFWCKFYNMRSFACYSMSRKAMGRWISLFEFPFSRRGEKLRIADQYLNCERIGKEMNLYHSFPNAAVQVPICGSNSGAKGCFDQFYRDFGLDLEAYASA